MATVLESDPVAPPLKLYDCAPVGDGAAAVLVTTAELAAELDRPQVRVAGSGASANNIAVAERDMTDIAGARVATETAYEDAGSTPRPSTSRRSTTLSPSASRCLAEAAGFAPAGTRYRLPATSGAG